MNIEQVNQIIDSKKAGTYLSIKYKTVGKSDTYKIVTAVVRVVKYVSTSTNKRISNDIKIGHVNVHINKDNSKSNTVLFHTTKNYKHKPQVKYFDNNREITKQEYELFNKPSNSIKSDIFCKKVDDIISLK